MSRCVLDSSILIAVFRNEQVEADILRILEGSVMSTVNLAEVWTKLHDLGLAQDARIEAVFAMLDRPEPFTASQANLAASLRPATRHLGLSLGDRACLALALEIGAEVYTADRAWADIQVGCAIHLIR